MIGILTKINSPLIVTCRKLENEHDIDEGSDGGGEAWVEMQNFILQQ